MQDTFNQSELKILKSLNNPKKVQDFLNKIKINFEEQEDTCMSPHLVLKKRKAHCMEGALFAAAALELQGHPAKVLDLTAAGRDFDHVVAVFRQHGNWGAISKTNHAVLRYREPVYKTIRELVMSYFHEYFMDNGKKTLRSYSNPISLKRFNKINWKTSEANLFEIPEYLAEVKHHTILKKHHIKNLRRADKIEIQAGKIIQFKKDKD